MLTGKIEESAGGDDEAFRLFPSPHPRPLELLLPENTKDIPSTQTLSTVERGAFDSEFTRALKIKSMSATHSFLKHLSPKVSKAFLSSSTIHTNIRNHAQQIYPLRLLRLSIAYLLLLGTIAYAAFHWMHLGPLSLQHSVALQIILSSVSAILVSSILIYKLHHRFIQAIVREQTKLGKLKAAESPATQKLMTKKLDIHSTKAIRQNEDLDTIYLVWLREMLALNCDQTDGSAARCLNPKILTDQTLRVLVRNFIAVCDLGAARLAVQNCSTYRCKSAKPIRNDSQPDNFTYSIYGNGSIVVRVVHYFSGFVVGTPADEKITGFQIFPDATASFGISYRATTEKKVERTVFDLEHTMPAELEVAIDEDYLMMIYTVLAEDPNPTDRLAALRKLFLAGKVSSTGGDGTTNPALQALMSLTPPPSTPNTPGSKGRKRRFSIFSTPKPEPRKLGTSRALAHSPSPDVTPETGSANSVVGSLGSSASRTA